MTRATPLRPMAGRKAETVGAKFGGGPALLLGDVLRRELGGSVTSCMGSLPPSLALLQRAAWVAGRTKKGHPPRRKPRRAALASVGARYNKEACVRPWEIQAPEWEGVEGGASERERRQCNRATCHVQTKDHTLACPVPRPHGPVIGKLQGGPLPSDRLPWA